MQTILGLAWHCEAISGDRELHPVLKGIVYKDIFTLEVGGRELDL